MREIVDEDIRVVAIETGHKLFFQFENDPGLDHGHEVTDGGWVSTDIIHPVTIIHGPIDTLRWLYDTMRVVAVAFELGFVLEDGVKDSLEDAAVPC